MGNLTQQARTQRLSALVAGQRIIAIERADGGAVGIRTEAGELVVIASILRDDRDARPVLVLDWVVPDPLVASVG